MEQREYMRQLAQQQAMGALSQMAQWGNQPSRQMGNMPEPFPQRFYPVRATTSDDSDKLLLLLEEDE